MWSSERQWGLWYSRPSLRLGARKYELNLLPKDQVCFIHSFIHPVTKYLIRTLPYDSSLPVGGTDGKEMSIRNCWGERVPLRKIL